MKIKGYIYGIGVAMAVLFASCDTDNMKEVFQETTMGAAFSFGAQSVSFPANGYEGFDVEVTRANSAEAATISLTATLSDGSPLPAEINVPSTITFEAGEYRKMLHVTVGDIKSGVTYSVTISLDPSAASSFEDAITTKTISVYRDYTYSTLGTGKLVSEFFGAEGEAEIQKADDINWYKAISLYEDGYDVVFKIGDDGKTVTVDKQAIASDISGYGTAYVAGSGTLENGVITVTLEFTVSAGSFGTAKEIITLPAE
ncbi:hypothetical protein [uncultured Phocaeicola sp.]|jgi:hypothetical protein|uniref:hypothetical protein n=1 Tax=uncultured Phocaeicola sp. TaxID=990718 RepID=UPI0015AFE3F8|nr:hypothetical protein [uncultured Phocaeicola sp.]